MTFIEKGLQVLRRVQMTEGFDEGRRATPADAAILAVGSARQVPIVKDGQLAIGTMMKITISADHRVTDGAEAAQYLQKLKSLLENPMRLLL